MVQKEIKPRPRQTETKQTFGDFLVSVSICCIQVDSFDQFHVVQKRVEGHEIWEAYPVSTGSSCSSLNDNSVQLRLPDFLNKSIASRLKIRNTYCHQICLDIFCEQMAFDGYHDILEIQSRYEPRTIFISFPKSLCGRYLMEVLIIEM